MEENEEKEFTCVYENVPIPVDVGEGGWTQVKFIGDCIYSPYSYTGYSINEQNHLVATDDLYKYLYNMKTK